jgi:hypothetical protein
MHARNEKDTDPRTRNAQTVAGAMYYWPTDWTVPTALDQIERVVTRRRFAEHVGLRRQAEHTRVATKAEHNSRGFAMLIVGAAKDLATD